NSPVAFNRILSGQQFWDGRAGSLEEQAIGPIGSPIEMGSTHDQCVETLAAIPAYRIQFDRVFADGVTIENVGRAIASFERVIVTGPSAWDQHDRLARFEKAFAEDLADPEYLAEEEPELLAEHAELRAASEQQPMSDSAERGAALFFASRSGCAVCHVGANFTDELYHNLGVGYGSPSRGDGPDLGRFEVTGEEQDRGAFKTPTLRNVADTGPYMHDGSQQTLAEVVAWYNKGGHANDHLSDKIKPLGLTAVEQADLVAFMESLTCRLPAVERGRLPR
ncbi:MAG: cytochrome c peroxidase, partial [Planctomycetota bacterium]